MHSSMGSDQVSDLKAAFRNYTPREIR